MYMFNLRMTDEEKAELERKTRKKAERLGLTYLSQSEYVRMLIHEDRPEKTYIERTYGAPKNKPVDA